MTLTGEQQRIIEDSLWIVGAVGKRLRVKDEDARSEAVLYMIQCLDRFDPSKGVKWETYAYKNVYLYMSRTMKTKQEKEKLTGLEWLVQKKLELADKNREEKSSSVLLLPIT